MKKTGTYIKAPKIEKQMGTNKDGYKQGGVVIEATDPTESQTITVKGTRALRKDKKPVKATWY